MQGNAENQLSEHSYLRMVSMKCDDDHLTAVADKERSSVILLHFQLAH
jgi:hypothetical protein